MPVARRSAAKRIANAQHPAEGNGVHDIGKKGPLCTNEQFRNACMLASKDPASGAERMQHLAETADISTSTTNVSANGAAKGDKEKAVLDNMVELASMCVTGLYGPLGSRKSLRHTAVLVIDKVLARDPGHLEALCLKGEMLIPRTFYGFPGARSNVPLSVLEEAFGCFSKAAEAGSNEGTFLKGRYLVTMAPKYKRSMEAEGKLLVETAAKNGSARALVFLAQRLEFDTDGKDTSKLFGRNVPVSKVEREKIVFDLYLKAADMGNGDALNDVGSCYATGFGSVGYNFEIAAKYYVRAIDAGSLHAFDNLGTHYEYGMSGNAPDKIDLEKAVYYYRSGARMRCSKCAMNLANSYEEGLYREDGVVVMEKDPIMAEKFLKYAVAIANDEDDSSTASAGIKELVMLYITRMKTNPHDDPCVYQCMKELKCWLPKKIRQGTMKDVDRSILKSVKEDSHTGQLMNLIGEGNAEKVFEVAKKLCDDIKTNGSVNSVQSTLLKHVFGVFAQEAADWTLSEQPSPKRRRSSN